MEKLPNDPHIFDMVCGKHDHGFADMPKPDGVDIVEFNDERGVVEFKYSYGYFDMSSNPNIIVHHPHYFNGGYHVTHTWNAIKCIVHVDNSTHWHEKYNEWFLKVHGHSLEEEAEIREREHRVLEDSAIDTLLRQMGIETDGY